MFDGSDDEKGLSLQQLRRRELVNVGDTIAIVVLLVVLRVPVKERLDLFPQLAHLSRAAQEQGEG